MGFLEIFKLDCILTAVGDAKRPVRKVIATHTEGIRRPVDGAWPGLDVAVERSHSIAQRLGTVCRDCYETRPLETTVGVSVGLVRMSVAVAIGVSIAFINRAAGAHMFMRCRAVNKSIRCSRVNDNLNHAISLTWTSQIH